MSKESVKIIPLGGQAEMGKSMYCIEVNEKIVESPEILNESPFEEGWLVKIENADAHAESGDLLEYNDYKEELE